MDKAQRKDFKFWRVADISVAHFIHDIYSSFLSAILPLIKEKLGLSYFLVSTLPMFGRAPSAVNFLIGLMAEKMAIRYFIILAPLVTTITMSLIGVANTYTELAILLFLMGWSSAFFHVAGPVMIKRMSGEMTGLGMSFYMFAGEAARSAGPLLIAFAIEDLWGLEGSWRLMPIGLLASAILYFRLRQLKRTDFKAKNNNPFKGAWASFVQMIPFFGVITGYTFIRGINRALITTLLTLYLVDAKDFDITTAALWLAISQGFAALGTLSSGYVSDLIGRRTILFIVALITPVFLLLFIHTGGVLQLTMLSAAAFFMSASSPVILALVNDKNKEKQSFTNGIYMTISFAFSMGAIAIAGISIDIIGLEKTYQYAPFFALLTLPFALMMPKR